jgi:hypothetical protein
MLPDREKEVSTVASGERKAIRGLVTVNSVKMYG